jgi:hypothetical protein
VYPAAGSYPPGPSVTRASPPAVERSGRRGFLAMPFVGIHAIEGSNGAHTDPGLRAGVLLGGRVGSMFSINGELNFDLVNVNDLPPGESFVSAKAVLSVSPLLHVHEGPLEMVLGPKLGLFGFAYSEAPAGGETASGHGSGFAVGLNAGAFASVSRHMSVGGLISFESLSVRQSCFTPAGSAENCKANPGPADPVLGITGAMLF